MSIRTPSPSMFRPKHGIDQSVLDANKKLIAEIDRRKLLRGAVSLGALSMLTGCDVTNQDSVQRALQGVSSWNDVVQQFLFRPNHLAPTFPELQVVKPPRFNAYYGIEDVKPVDGANWKLELAGRIQDKTPWTAEQMRALPEQEIIIRHICVEGWDYIGQWSGVNLRQFLERIGADTQGQIRRLQVRRRLHREPRHGDGAPPANHARHQICARADHRSVRVSVAAAHLDQARFQECEMDHRHRGNQRFPEQLLAQARLQLVRRHLD